MPEDEFEGSLILEKLAEIGKIEDFYDAVDSDNFSKAQSLMELAGVDEPSIATVLKKMQDEQGEH